MPLTKPASCSAADLRAAEQAAHALVAHCLCRARQRPPDQESRCPAAFALANSSLGVTDVQLSDGLPWPLSDLRGELAEDVGVLGRIDSRDRAASKQTSR